MPVEIRELVIQACLSEGASAPGAGGKAPEGKDNLEAQLRTLEQKIDIRFKKLRQELLKECITEVLEILEEKQRILR